VSLGDSTAMKFNLATARVCATCHVAKPERTPSLMRVWIVLNDLLERNPTEPVGYVIFTLWEGKTSRLTFHILHYNP